jgi:hypothetical protein
VSFPERRNLQQVVERLDREVSADRPDSIRNGVPR